MCQTLVAARGRIAEAIQAPVRPSAPPRAGAYPPGGSAVGQPLRERIRDVKIDQRRRGRFLGGKAPFGYRVADGYLVEEPGERAAIATMRELRARGVALRAIAAEVEARHGVRISHMTVKAVLADAERSAA